MGEFKTLVFQISRNTVQKILEPTNFQVIHAVQSFKHSMNNSLNWQTFKIDINLSPRLTDILQRCPHFSECRVVFSHQRFVWFTFQIVSEYSHRYFILTVESKLKRKLIQIDFPMEC